MANDIILWKRYESYDILGLDLLRNLEFAHRIFFVVFTDHFLESIVHITPRMCKVVVENSIIEIFFLRE